jgi:hypothetical protein
MVGDTLMPNNNVSASSKPGLSGREQRPARSKSRTEPSRDYAQVPVQIPISPLACGRIEYGKIELAVTIEVAVPAMKASDLATDLC